MNKMIDHKKFGSLVLKKIIFLREKVKENPKYNYHPRSCAGKNAKKILYKTGQLTPHF